MKETVGTKGLIFNEPLLWEKGVRGRTGFSMPRRDIEEAPMDEKLKGSAPDFPDLSEVDVVRHYTRLSQWNFGVDSGMYPLGSCTMKYNPKTNERQAALPGFAAAHPLVPVQQSQGILHLLFDLQHYLAEVTGMDAVSLQPAAGAHGELAGMLICHAYHVHKGKPRSKILIPDTAHGTNPASASLCGFKSIPVKSNAQGILSPEVIGELMDEDTAGIMVTNPNTLGLFEDNIKRVAEIVHAKGGLIYCDGANMNAVMGIIDMKAVGVDILHLNLHKTFSTPHGGGGPGSGPVCVTKELEKFLPVPRVVFEQEQYLLSNDFPDTIGKLHAFYGNVGVQIKAYSYILSMGAEGLKQASQIGGVERQLHQDQAQGELSSPLRSAVYARVRIYRPEAVRLQGIDAGHCQAVDGLWVSSPDDLLPVGGQRCHYDRAHRNRTQRESGCFHRRHAGNCRRSRKRSGPPAPGTLASQTQPAG